MYGPGLNGPYSRWLLLLLFVAGGVAGYGDFAMVLLLAALLTDERGELP